MKQPSCYDWAFLTCSLRLSKSPGSSDHSSFRASHHVCAVMICIGPIVIGIGRSFWTKPYVAHLLLRRATPPSVPLWRALPRPKRWPSSTDSPPLPLTARLN